jgi:hypothetical protein
MSVVEPSLTVAAVPTTPSLATAAACVTVLSTPSVTAVNGVVRPTVRHACD